MGLIWKFGEIETIERRRNKFFQWKNEVKRKPIKLRQTQNFSRWPWLGRTVAASWYQRQSVARFRRNRSSKSRWPYWIRHRRTRRFLRRRIIWPRVRKTTAATWTARHRSTRTTLTVTIQPIIITITFTIIHTIRFLPLVPCLPCPR